MQIFLLMGQSNMAGRGILEDVEEIRDDRIRVFDAGQWHQAEEPLHHDRPSAGVGLAMSFGATLLQHEPETTIGFVPCAVGSTSIARWIPGADLFERAMEWASAAKSSGTIKGILWHQGEHDSQREADANNYQRNVSSMLGGVRDRVNDPTLPVVVGGLGRFLTARPDFPFFEIVNDTLQRLPQTVAHCGFASSEGLMDKGDSLHFDAQSQRELGHRYATVYQLLTEAIRTGP